MADLKSKLGEVAEKEVHIKNGAELEGLRHGETLIDAIINDYLNNYGG